MIKLPIVLDLFSIINNIRRNRNYLEVDTMFNEGWDGN